MKFIAAWLLALMLGSCAISNACDDETRAHAFYVSFIAPFRPPVAVQLEAAVYGAAMAACAKYGATAPQTQAALATAAAAKQ